MCHCHGPVSATDGGLTFETHGLRRFEEIAMKLHTTVLCQHFCVALIIWCLGGCASSVPSAKQEVLAPLTPFSPESRYVIAVLPFQFKGEQEGYSSFGDKLLDLVVVELFNTGRFRIVERSRIDAVLKEMELSQAGITEGSLANQVGEQLGAERVIVGTLSAVKAIQDRDSMGFIWKEARGFEVSLNGRLIDVSRGEIAAVGEGSGIEVQKQKMAMGAKTGSIDPDETLINKALEKAVKILVHDLAAKMTPKRGD